jgi:hypothetical protein
LQQSPHGGNWQHCDAGPVIYDRYSVVLKAVSNAVGNSSAMLMYSREGFFGAL